VLISHERIAERAAELAKLIVIQYPQNPESAPIVLVCVLKGSMPFYNLLCNYLQDLKVNYTCEYIFAKSYKGTRSTGNVSVSGINDYSVLRDRNVLVVEDIVDTGATLSQLLPILQDSGKPKTLEVISLLDKRLGSRKMEVAKFVGFSIPDQFIIGFGLDCNEFYRDLRDIWVISDLGVKFATT